MMGTDKILNSEEAANLLSELATTNKKMVEEIERLSARLRSIEVGESQRDRWVDDKELPEWSESKKEPDHLRLQTLFQNGLSRAEQLIITLYYYENHTHKEIGRILDLSESRIRQMHSSVLARLKDQMHHDSTTPREEVRRYVDQSASSSADRIALHGIKKPISKTWLLRKLYDDIWRNLYHWTSTALHESRKESEKSHLQVSRDDYRKVVEAIQESFDLEEHISAKLICAQMDKVAALDGGSAVPSTQLYLVLRFLKASGLIRKCGGSSYEYVGGDSVNSFSEKALSLNKDVNYYRRGYVDSSPHYAEWRVEGAGPIQD